MSQLGHLMVATAATLKGEKIWEYDKALTELHGKQEYCVTASQGELSVSRYTLCAHT